MKILLVFLAMFLYEITFAGHPDVGIYYSALKGDVCGIARAISSGGTVNQQYPFTNGHTPIMAAIISGDWNTVNFLFRFGADPYTKNNDKNSNEYGWSALEYAINYQNKDKASKEKIASRIDILNLIELKIIRLTQP